MEKRKLTVYSIWQYDYEYDYGYALIEGEDLPRAMQHQSASHVLTFAYS
jgi:hypothetical protein